MAVSFLETCSLLPTLLPNGLKTWHYRLGTADLALRVSISPRLPGPVALSDRLRKLTSTVGKTIVATGGCDEALLHPREESDRDHGMIRINGCSP